MKNNKNYHKGYYFPTYPQKYKGSGNPFFRSSYEEKCFAWCDHNINVLAWAVEYMAIPYLYEIDNKMHKYYPDVFCKVQLKDGTTVKYIIEIKPYRQTLQPDEPKNKNSKRQTRYVYEMCQYTKNKNKWDATKKYCEKYGYIFKIITEKDLWKK